MIDYIEVMKAGAIIRALKNKKCQKILALLEKKGELSVTDIRTMLKWEQSVASIQLGVLRRAKIVTSRYDNKFVYYTLDTDKIQAIVNGIKVMVG